MSLESGVVERALIAARDGQLSGDRLLETLAEGEVWVPLPEGAPAAEGESASIPMMLIGAAKYLPVYTSAEEFSQGAGDMAHMVSPLRELARQLPDDFGIAVNPGGSVGLPIHPQGVDVLRGGQRNVPAGTQVRLGQPEAEPAELLAALRRAFGSLREVESVRSGWAQFGEAEPGLLLGIVLDPDSEEARQEVLAAVTAARGEVPEACGVDCVFGASGDTLADWLTANGVLQYER